MFTLRRYTAADQEVVEQLHVSVIQQTGAYLGRGPWDDDVYAIEEVYLKNGGEFLIGECDGLVVAMGALRRTGPQRAEIKRTTDIFRSQIDDVTASVYTVQLSGTSDKLDSFIQAIGTASILETVRSGVTGIARGDKVLSI